MKRSGLLRLNFPFRAAVAVVVVVVVERAHCCLVDRNVAHVDSATLWNSAKCITITCI